MTGRIVPHPSRRDVLKHASGLAAMLLGRPGLAALPNGWPNRPVKIVIPTTVGGQQDLFARQLSNHFGKVFGQPFIVESKPGATGAIGGAAVAKAPADGYTLLYSNSSYLLVVRAMGVPQPYELKELAPIGIFAAGGTMLAVNGNSEIKTLKQLLSIVRTNPGKYAYGTFGVGSSSHLAMESILHKAGLKMTHAPYKGVSEVIRDLAGGVLEIAWVDTSASLPLIKAGRIRPLAVAADARLPASPDVPTLLEEGFNFSGSGYQALFAPAGTPQPIIEALNAEMMNLLQTEEARKLMASLNALVPPRHTPDDLAKDLARDFQAWRKIVVDNGLKPE
jgi:tripartite-type tricarboxylate transporter receptor subunit TctC